MKPVRTHVGHPDQARVIFTPQDWYTSVGNPQTKIREPATLSAPLMLHVDRPGLYRVTLSQYPLEARKARSPGTAEIKIGERLEKKRIEKGRNGTSFELRLIPGKIEMEALFRMDSGEEGSAYYVYMELLGD